MSTIGGPGGIGGPKGPQGPDDLDGPDKTLGDQKLERASPAPGAGAASDVDALAAEVAAGRLTPREAIDRLVDATAGPELGPAERAELREMLVELIANDPYLGVLANRV